MTVYNEIASIDGSAILEKFKEAVAIEHALVSFISAKGKCSTGGSARIETVTKNLSGASDPARFKL